MTHPAQPTEIHGIARQWMSGIQKITQDFPLLSAIFTVAAGVFGFLAFFHFTISAIVTSTMLIGLATSFGITVVKEGSSYWKGLGTSLLNIGKFITGNSAKTTS